MLKWVFVVWADVYGADLSRQVYLCMRVLLCRMGGQHLAGFWPVILTELVRASLGSARPG